jgi:predicted signal transduction protein with EAL and GGDEF domain
VSRLGGDKFAVVIPAAVVGEDVAGFIQSLHGAACQAVSLGDTIYLPSFSMGVTRYLMDSRSVEGLMINADMALYEAKRNGRNQWCFFDPKVRNRIEYRQNLKSITTAALEDDLFEIAMQPICCFETGAHLGFEVLVRLRHQGAAVPPDHFIPLAEELGLIVPIGRTVRRKALVARRKMSRRALPRGGSRLISPLWSSGRAGSSKMCRTFCWNIRSPLRIWSSRSRKPR